MVEESDNKVTEIQNEKDSQTENQLENTNPQKDKPQDLEVSTENQETPSLEDKSQDQDDNAAQLNEITNNGGAEDVASDESNDNNNDLVIDLDEDDLDDDEWWNQADEYSSDQRKKLESLYDSTLKVFEENEIVTGTVVSVGDKEIILNIGFKSEGVIPASEFRGMKDLSPGKEVEVFIESVEDKNGQLILSRKRAKSLRAWERINEALDGDTIMEGTVMRRTKGGFVVDIEGIEAFLPGSQIDVKPVRDFDAYVGKHMEFKVVKINHAYENVVVSHKVLIEEKLQEQRIEILKNLEEGQVLEGTVKNMTNFGVFIDLGGVDGLLHITDISWGRINHPEEVLELDQKVNVVVLDFDDNKNRISLGMKQLSPHPWDSLAEEVQEGSKVNGKVVTVADYGIFLEIMPGVEGLVHTSEMSWSQHVKNPTETFKVGDELEAVVLSIDREERKMSLGLKQLLTDPWDEVEIKYPINSRHNGIVRNMTNYGLFVELEEGVDGLVHISDLSWTKKFNHPSEFVKVSDSLEVVVLEIDKENRRLSLGHKQLTEDAWETFAAIFTVGSPHKGTIKRIDSKGAVVELEYGVEGTVPPKHLKVAPEMAELKVDDVVDLIVIEFNKEAKKLQLSHTRTWKEEPVEKKRKKSKPSAKMQQKSGTTTLGELDVLAKLKEQMETQEKKQSDPAPKKKAAAKVKEEVTEKVEEVVEKVEETTDKVEEVVEKVEEKVEEVVETTDKVEETADKVEEKAEEVVETTDKVEETAEKVEDQVEEVKNEVVEEVQETPEAKEEEPAADDAENNSADDADASDEEEKKEE